MATSSERSFQFESFTLNASEGVLLYHGRRVPLAPKTFRTLLALVEKAGHIVTKEDLSKRIWGDTVVGEENLTFHISALRKIFAHFEYREEFIHTEHRIGYRFVPQVRVIEGGFLEGENAGPSGTGGSTAGMEAESGGDGVVGGRAKAGWKTNNLRFLGPNSGPQNDSIGEMEPRTGAMVREGVEGRGRWRRWAKWIALLAGPLAVTAGAAWLAGPRPQPTALRWQQITADGRDKRGELATDGERLFFIEQFPTGWAVAQISAQGGEAVPLAAVPKESSVTSISSDHRELLVVEDRDVTPGSVEVLPLFGGEPRRLGDVRAYSAEWSPDGASLAYTTDGGVYVGGADGSNPLRSRSSPCRDN
jgi:DNA-binding winged helix-turn-helix (wHTH) protein